MHSVVDKSQFLKRNLEHRCTVLGVTTNRGPHSLYMDTVRSNKRRHIIRTVQRVQNTNN